MHSVFSLFTLDKVTGYDLLRHGAGTVHNLWVGGGNGDFFLRGINFHSKHLGGAIKIQLTTPVKKSITYHNALCLSPQNFP